MSNSLRWNMSEHQLTNKNVVQQIGVKSYILNLVAWKVYNITFVLKNVYTKWPSPYIMEIRSRMISEKKQAVGQRHDLLCKHVLYYKSLTLVCLHEKADAECVINHWRSHQIRRSALNCDSMKTGSRKWPRGRLHGKSHWVGCQGQRPQPIAVVRRRHLHTDKVSDEPIWTYEFC